MLSDSFFIDEGLIGNFSKKKIEETIKWLNKADYKNDAEYYEQLIRNIDEPIVKIKLSEMYDEKMSKNIEEEIIDEQIRKLEELRRNLKRS